ncbi:MAG: tRNA modification GTPase [Phycisphaerae bacterium]|nr:tRNA modification GTPase [Phycisphaerae bacterium]
MFDVLDDTIVAISSAIGHSPRGIVRLCGCEAIRIACELFAPDDGPDLAERAGHTCCLGRLRLTPPKPTPAIPAEAYLFRKPRSYTRQDIVELHTLGSPPVLSMILQYCFSSGARLAEPGEFTARAFFSGQLDLSEVEGVGALIHAESDAQLRAGERLLHGILSRRARDLQDRLADVLALVEADIDFAEEPIDFIRPDDLRGRLRDIAADIRTLVGSSLSSERIETLPRVMLLGPPNVGKSSLLNRLSGVDRAICSPLPGTTRDVLTAPLEMDGSEAILVDAAGMGRTETYIDRLADSAVHDAARQADLMLFVVDLSAEPVRPSFELLDDLPERPLIVVANKTDLVDPAALRARLARIAPPRGANVLPVSARTGSGRDELIRAIERVVHTGSLDAGAEAIALNSRHRHALTSAAEAVDRAIAVAADLTDTLDAAELIAVELRQAGDDLGQIAGQLVTDDLLGRIFEGFCIGK